jgi:hypothetical protein
MTQEIKPTHVTFEQYESYCDLKLLQLLYDKGFRFKLETEGHRVINNLAEQRFNEGDVSYCNNYITYSVVVEWLRINHGIWINVYYKPKYKQYDYSVVNINWNEEELSKNLKKDIDEILENIFKEKKKYDSPQEAYSAAIDYIKNNNLI